MSPPSSSLFYWIDSFTDQLFKGNPAGVCLLAHAIPEAQMQSIAREVNLSETAFVVSNKDGFDLRWFTPTVEVDLCGHGTLAAAFALWDAEWTPIEVAIKFETKSGVLRAEKKAETIFIDLPALAVASNSQPMPELFQALGIEPVPVWSNETTHLLELPSEESLKSIRPDFARMRAASKRSIIVTTQSKDPQYDFVSRYFTPREGINEDPVTGFAHCHLGHFWGARLNKTELVGYQASNRGGVVQVHTRGNRALLGGQARILVRGKLAETNL